jgi:hypothetical protein
MIDTQALTVVFSSGLGWSVKKPPLPSYLSTGSFFVSFLTRRISIPNSFILLSFLYSHYLINHVFYAHRLAVGLFGQANVKAVVGHYARYNAVNAAA